MRPGGGAGGARTSAMGRPTAAGPHSAAHATPALVVPAPQPSLSGGVSNEPTSGSHATREQGAPGELAPRPPDTARPGVDGIVPAGSIIRMTSLQRRQQQQQQLQVEGASWQLGQLPQQQPVSAGSVYGAESSLGVPASAGGGPRPAQARSLDAAASVNRGSPSASPASTTASARAVGAVASTSAAATAAGAANTRAAGRFVLHQAAATSLPDPSSSPQPGSPAAARADGEGAVRGRRSTSSLLGGPLQPPMLDVSRTLASPISSPSGHVGAPTQEQSSHGLGSSRAAAAHRLGSVGGGREEGAGGESGTLGSIRAETGSFARGGGRIDRSNAVGYRATGAIPSSSGDGSSQAWGRQAEQAAPAQVRASLSPRPPSGNPGGPGTLAHTSSGSGSGSLVATPARSGGSVSRGGAGQQGGGAPGGGAVGGGSSLATGGFAGVSGWPVCAGRRTGQGACFGLCTVGHCGAVAFACVRAAHRQPGRAVLRRSAVGCLRACVPLTGSLVAQCCGAVLWVACVCACRCQAASGHAALWQGQPSSSRGPTCLAPNHTTPGLTTIQVVRRVLICGRSLPAMIEPQSLCLPRPKLAAACCWRASCRGLAAAAQPPPAVRSSASL